MDRLEARFSETFTSAAAEEHEKQVWLARARICRNEAKPRDVRRARDLIGLFRTQGILSEMSAEELVDRIVSWRPMPEGGCSRTTVEREVALATYGQESGTGNMVCPTAWRESFVAGDELRERYSRVPNEMLASAELRWAPESFGITEKLLKRAVGPDVGEIDEEEVLWRLREYLAEEGFGQRGYEIEQHARQVENEREKL